METRQLEFYRNSFAEEDRGGKGEDIYILRCLQRGREGERDQIEVVIGTITRSIG